MARLIATQSPSFCAFQYWQAYWWGEWGLQNLSWWWRIGYEIRLRFSRIDFPCFPRGLAHSLRCSTGLRNIASLSAFLQASCPPSLAVLSTSITIANTPLTVYGVSSERLRKDMGWHSSKMWSAFGLTKVCNCRSRNFHAFLSLKMTIYQPQMRIRLIILLWLQSVLQTRLYIWACRSI